MNARLFAIAVAGFVGIAGSVSAQRSVRLAVGGGTATPVGVFGETARTGANVLGGIAWASDWNFLGARIDYSANTFNGRSVGGVEYKDKTAPAVVASVVAAVPLGYIKPYIIAGPGWYPFREATDRKRGNDYGFAGGAGVTFPFLGASWFLESRYHSVHRQTAAHFVPVTFGVLL